MAASVTEMGGDSKESSFETLWSLERNILKQQQRKLDTNLVNPATTETTKVVRRSLLIYLLKLKIVEHYLTEWLLIN